MKFSVLTLFPDMFSPLKQSIIGKAIEDKKIELNLINIRDFSKDKRSWNGNESRCCLWCLWTYKRWKG